MNRSVAKVRLAYYIRLLAGCALAGVAWGLLVGQAASAAPVNSQVASDAVVGWLRLDHQPLGQHLSGSVRQTETIKDASGAPLYHIVHLIPSGYVIMAADDTLEPIIAFSGGGRFEASSRDPVAALANRDLTRRMKRARAGVLGAHSAEAHRKWRGLLLASPNPPPDAEENDAIVMVSQVWVAPFLQTLWSQTSDVSLQDACYNYYTPPDGAGNVNNYPCGCVATCLAQLMYYYQYPTVGVGTKGFLITVDNVPTTANLRGGNGAGGPYSWANMPLSPNSPSAAQAQAIGALCFDAGVAVNMDYAEAGSSASVFTAQNALTNVFKFSNAGYDEDDVNGLGGPSLLSMINPSLDARLPVPLGVNSLVEGGHCVVCDGYGYSGGTIFHHFNAGWAGDNDIWYALPNFNTPDLGDFIIDSCLYNIFTNGTGGIISGRVTDPTGAPVVGASVAATRVGGGSFAATTDTNGIYALAHVAASSQYALTVTDTGYASASGNYSTGAQISDTANSGNFWGANFVLSPPLLAMPETGFSAVGPVAGPFTVMSQTYTLTNTTSSAVGWSLASTASWLKATASNGTVAAGAASTMTVSLNTAVGSLKAGNYVATIFLTNLNNDLTQALPFTLTVNATNYPIALTGFNADVVVENLATGGNTTNYADTFDPNCSYFSPPSAVCFYEAGLTAGDLLNGKAAALGLPTNGLFTSLVDNATTFQFAPYDNSNVLYLTSSSTSGALTLTTLAAYKSLSVLAASAQGAGNGAVVIHFADGTTSLPMPFTAANYIVTNQTKAPIAGAAITNFGLLVTGDYTEYYSVDAASASFPIFPCLYQTTINLQSLGLHTKPITSLSFTMPTGTGVSANTVTGVFALSGMESPFPMITAQPQSVAAAAGGNIALSVGVAGAVPLSYHWSLNGTTLAGAQSSLINLTNVAATNAGSYQVIVTNSSGAVTSAVAVVSITNEPVSFVTGAGALQFSGGKLILQLTNLTGQGPVVVSASTNLLQWIPIFTNPSGFGGFTITDTAVGSFPQRYYRATTP